MCLPGVFRGGTLLHACIYPTSSLFASRDDIGSMQGTCRVPPRKTPGKHIESTRKKLQHGIAPAWCTHFKGYFPIILLPCTPAHHFSLASKSSKFSVLYLSKSDWNNLFYRYGTDQFFFVHPLQMRVNLISIFPLENRYSILLYPFTPSCTLKPTLFGGKLGNMAAW